MKNGFYSSDGDQGSNCYLRNRHAFSLVEVVLALGIATFAVVAIAALLPVSLQSSKDSLEESSALNVLSEVVADRQAMPLTSTTVAYQLSALTPAMTPITNTFGIIKESQYSASLSQARYKVTCSFTPPAVGTLNPYLGYFKVSWPASSPNATGYVETVVTFSQP